MPEQGNPGAGPYATRLIFARRDVAGFHNFVPRVSFVFDVFGNTKTALKMSYGRFSDNVGTGFADVVNPVSLRTSRYAWDGTLPITPALAARSRLITAPGQTTLPLVDPNLKNALTDEYTAGIEHELVRDFGISATFVRKFAFNRYTTWVFKLLGTYELPRGFTVSGTYESQKGANHTRTVQFNGAGRNMLTAGGAIRTTNLAQGWLTLTMDPPGSYFMPNVNILNIRAEKTFRITDRHRVSGMFDLFNITNANTIIGVETLSNTLQFRGSTVPRFGRATTILNPIIFRLGLRCRF